MMCVKDYTSDPGSANNNENNLILAVAKHPYAENISSTPPPPSVIMV